MTECEYMLERMQDYRYTKVSFLFDRGYYTEDTLRFLDQRWRMNTLFVRTLIEEVAPELKHDA